MSSSLRAKEIFLEALGMEPFERDRFLGEACGEDARLESRVRDLLRAHSRRSVLAPFERQARSSLEAFWRRRDLGLD